MAEEAWIGECLRGPKILEYSEREAETRVAGGRASLRRKIVIHSGH